MKQFTLVITHLFILIFSAASLAQQKAVPCSSEEHAQFDFWIGEWSVTAGGKAAGKNKIEKIEGGCVLRESWSSATSPYTGTSYNFYNQNDKQWEQLWLDNQGGFLKLAGHRTGNQMILKSAPAKNEAGDQVTQSITWTQNEDGSVRQHWEVLTDGKDTTIAFDGLYKKAE